jgi:hypothetical protein
MAGPLSGNEILENLRLLSDWLEVKHPGEEFELTLLGGAAMALDGHKDQTRDVDVLEPVSLPGPLKAGIAFISKAKKLGPEWINTNAASIFRKRKRSISLPVYFKKTSRTIQVGKNLGVRLLGRQGLISTKLLAATPSYSKHTRDLKELAPTKKEIREAVRFVLSMDAHESRVEDLRIILDELGYDFDEIRKK